MMAPPKTIRTSQGDILNELKRRKDINERGKSKIWRAAKKHYLPNMIGQAVALVGATQAVAPHYRERANDRASRVRNRELTSDKPNLKKMVSNSLMPFAPEFIAGGVGLASGANVGRMSHKREKLMIDRLKEHEHDHLFNSLSDRGKEDYALFLGKHEGAPILKKLEEKRIKERNAVKEFKKQYKSTVQDEDLEKEAASAAASKAMQDWGMANVDKTPKKEIYDELAIRRAEAIGKKAKGLKRRDFKDSFKKNLFDSNKLKAHAIIGTLGGIVSHQNYKDHLEDLASKNITEMPGNRRTGFSEAQRLNAARFTTPLLLGPALHAGLSASKAALDTVSGVIKRKKNRFQMADFTTSELEKKLGRTMLTKLYREHGEEGEEHHG